MMCISGPPGVPGKMALSMALAYSSLQRDVYKRQQVLVSEDTVVKVKDLLPYYWTGDNQ